MHTEGRRGGARGAKGGRGRGAGRQKKNKRVISSDEEDTKNLPISGTKNDDGPSESMEVDPATSAPSNSVPDANPEIKDVGEEDSSLNTSTKIDIEADISQLEAPTFTTIQRGPPEPMVRLKWNHKVLVIGEKVLNPMIHCCDECQQPILIYGRMIPCKHVFCLTCAKSEPLKECPRCNDKVVRVENGGLGSVFMCTHGGSLYNNKGCRRTYLSQRDLQAHINHRHVTAPPRTEAANSSNSSTTVKPNPTDSPAARKPPQTQASFRQNPPPTATTSNLSVANLRNHLLNLDNASDNIMDQDHIRNSSRGSFFGNSVTGTGHFDQQWKHF